MNEWTVINNPNYTPVEAPKPELSVVENKGKVIVADDAAVIRGIIKNTIQESYEVIEATNGEEAITQINELIKNGKFDKLVGLFLDLRMPGSDGFTVLRALDSLNITIPITVISGDDSMETIQQVCSKPNVDYISKPLGKPQILAACEKMARQKAMFSETSYQRVA